jgi:2'-5' RNA ligase
MYFPDKEDPSVYVLGIEPDKTSRIIVNELYRAGNIPELQSNRPSTIWTPHITIVR